MTKRVVKSKNAALKKDRAWFERKVAELKAEAEKLPSDRQEQLRRELENEANHQRVHDLTFLLLTCRAFKSSRSLNNVDI